MNFVTSPRTSFDVTEASLTSARGSKTYSEVLGDVTKFMIRHNAGDPSRFGTAQLATLGIDNVAAIPEPSTALLLLFGLIGLARGGARAHRR